MKQKDKRTDGISGADDGTNWVDADFLNQSQEELENVVRASGVAFDGDNEKQVAQAITDHVLGADYAIDSGTANNYVLAISGSRYLPNQLAVGYQIRFRTGNANTNTTPTANYGGLGVKTIVAENGTDAIAVGDIKVGVVNTLEYDGTNWRLILSKVNTASETLAGIIKIATSAQTAAGTNNTEAITPSKLFSLFSSGSLSADSGYFKIPFMIAGARANVIIQFGTDYTSTIVKNITFPIVFPTDCCAVIGTIVHTAAASVSVSQPTTTGFTAYKSSPLGFRWIALGYELI